jgi:hypothetical protein
VGGHGPDPLDSSYSVGHWSSPDLAGPWDEDDANPVLEPTPGSWDGYSIIRPAVWYDGATFHMWYGAVDVFHGVVSTGYATDTDGLGDWTKVAGPLAGLGPGIPGAWADTGAAPGTVLADGTNHGMWFTAFAGGVWGTWRLGYAASTDGGSSWSCNPDPVLEGLEPWEGVKVYEEEVVPYGTGFAMWYAGASTSLAQIGFAVSPDGLHWGRWPGNPVLSPLPGCNRVDSIAVLVDGDTVHGWVSNCNDIYYVTSSYEVFSDGFESGGTTLWSLTVP